MQSVRQQECMDSKYLKFWIYVFKKTLLEWENSVFQLSDALMLIFKILLGVNLKSHQLKKFCQQKLSDMFQRVTKMYSKSLSDLWGPCTPLPKQLCALAHQGITHTVGTFIINIYKFELYPFSK